MPILRQLVRFLGLPAFILGFLYEFLFAVTFSEGQKTAQHVLFKDMEEKLTQEFEAYLKRVNEEKSEEKDDDGTNAS